MHQVNDLAMWLAFFEHEVGGNNGSGTRNSLATVDKDLKLFLGALVLAGQNRLFLFTLAGVGIVFVRVKVGTRF